MTKKWSYVWGVSQSQLSKGILTLTLSAYAQAYL